MAKVKKTKDKKDFSSKKGLVKDLPNNSQNITENLPHINSQSEKKQKLPRNYRFITEKTVWISFFCILFLTAIFFLSQNIQSSQKSYQTLIKQQSHIKSQIIYWQKIIQNHPDYRDAYIQLAREEYQIGEDQKALNALQKAKQLDPNDKVIQMLEAKIEMY